MTDYNISVLIQAVRDYLYAEQELKLFLRTWTGGWWHKKTAQEREDYTKYTEQSSGKWDTVMVLCRLLDIESEDLIAMVKSIDRWERHSGKWDRGYCIINGGWRAEQNVRRYLTKTDGWGTTHYTSTGRKIAA